MRQVTQSGDLSTARGFRTTLHPLFCVPRCGTEFSKRASDQLVSASFRFRRLSSNQVGVRR